MDVISMKLVTERERYLSRKIIKEATVNKAHSEALLKNSNYSNTSIKKVLNEYHKNGDDSGFTFNEIIDLYDKFCETANESDIKYCSRLIEATIKKIRDPKNTRNLIKHKLGRIKGKLSSKITGNIDNIANATKGVINNGKSNLQSNVKNIKSSAKDLKSSLRRENTIIEQYENMLNMIENIQLCDRVIKNKQKLSKRFNFKNVIENYDDIYEATIELCKLIDTYDMPIDAKYNIALENIRYAYENTYITTDDDTSTIIEACTDYFLMNTEDESIMDKMESVLEANKFFKPKQKKFSWYVLVNKKKNKEKKNKEKSYGLKAGIETKKKKFDYAFQVDTKKIFENNLNEYLEESKKAESIVKRTIDNFKVSTDKSVSALKSTIINLYSKKEKNILDESMELFTFIRIFYVLGSFAINPVLGLVTTLTDRIIKIISDRAEAEKVIEKYKKEIETSKKKLEKLKTEESKERMEAYIKTLETNLKKIESYRDELYTTDENIERDTDNSDNSDDDISFDDLEDFNFEEQALNEMSIGNTLKATGMKFKKTLQKVSDQDKIVCRQIDGAFDNIQRNAQRALSNGNREAVIKGSIIPSASKVIKTAIVSGIGYAISPVLAVITFLGALGCSKHLRAKERQLILDEIEIELKMTERYIALAQEKNDMKALKQLLTTQRALERQKQRLKYNMSLIHNDKTSPVDMKED